MKSTIDKIRNQNNNHPKLRVHNLIFSVIFIDEAVHCMTGMDKWHQQKEELESLSM